MKISCMLAFALIIGVSTSPVAAKDATPSNKHGYVSSKHQKPQPPKSKSARSEKKLERKPDGTLGYRYTCSPSGFGQMGKCW